MGSITLALSKAQQKKFKEINWNYNILGGHYQVFSLAGNNVNGKEPLKMFIFISVDIASYQGFL